MKYKNKCVHVFLVLFYKINQKSKGQYFLDLGFLGPDLGLLSLNLGLNWAVLGPDLGPELGLLLWSRILKPRFAIYFCLSISCVTALGCVSVS